MPSVCGGVQGVEVGDGLLYVGEKGMEVEGVSAILMFDLAGGVFRSELVQALE